MLLLAQGMAGAIGYWAILLVLAIAIVGIVLVAARATGVTIPDWVTKILWIVLVALIAIAAIKFLLYNA